jgi:hypothetical protein
MELACRKEIIELHQFFEDWFNGRPTQTDESFSRMDEVMGDEFVIVMPRGVKVDRGPLLKGLFDAHGAQPGIRIWIENIRLHADNGPLIIVEYEEWQQTDEETVSRYSTAVFRIKEDTPNGIEWVHVHETWFNQE